MVNYSFYNITGKSKLVEAHFQVALQSRQECLYSTLFMRLFAVVMKPAVNAYGKYDDQYLQYNFPCFMQEPVFPAVPDPVDHFSMLDDLLFCNGIIIGSYF